MAKIGDILSELREDKNLTQQELAKLFHISGSSVSAYELGTRLPNVEILVAYAKYFDVSTDYILGLTQHPTKLSAANEYILADTTAEDIIADIKSLSDEQKSALLLILRSMRFHADITNKTQVRDRN